MGKIPIGKISTEPPYIGEFLIEPPHVVSPIGEFSTEPPYILAPIAKKPSLRREFSLSLLERIPQIAIRAPFVKGRAGGIAICSPAPIG